MPLAITYTDLQARRILLGLIVADCAFAIAYVVTHILLPEVAWGPVRPWFNIDSENSLPTWYSTILLAAVGAVLFLAARNNRQSEYLANSALYVAALLFVGLSADEGAQIHEKFDYTARHFGLDQQAFVSRFGAWTIAYAAFGLLGLGLASRHLKAFWQHFRSVAVVAVAGGVTYVAGAAGFDSTGNSLQASEAVLPGHLLVLAGEELLEMIGASVMLYAALVLANRLAVSRQPS